MKKILALSILLTLFSCGEETEPGTSETSSTADPGPQLRQPAHIIFVWLENKNYLQIINSASAP